MSETKTCVKCGAEKLLAKFHLRARRYRDNMCSACFGKRERARLKLKIIAALGGKCNCCGETHPAFLTLDHIQGLSEEQQKLRQARKESTIKAWRQAIREGCRKDKYQLLCMNCNFAKGHCGVCPHQSKISTEEALATLRNAAEGIGHNHRDFSGSSKTWFKPGHEGFRSVNPL